MLPEKLSDPALLKSAFCDGNHHIDQDLVGDAHLDAIHFQECKGGNSTHALVAVHERMILHDMEEVGCSHLEKVGMKVLATASSLGHRKSRLQERRVTDTGPPSVPPDLVTVDL